MIEGSVEVKDVHIAVPGARDVVVLRRVLLREGDIQLSAQVLHVERRIAGGDARIGERLDHVETGVEHFDVAGAEIGGVQQVGTADRSDRETFIDRPAA